MMVVAVELEDKVANDLKRESELIQTDEGTLIRKAIDAYLYGRRMDRLREQVRPYAEAAGFFSEEAIFRDIS